MLYRFAEKYDISIKLQDFLPHYKILLSVRNQVTFLRKWAHKKCYVLSANDVSRISDAEQSLKNEGEPQWSVYSICILNWGGKGTTTNVLLSEYYYILSVLWFGTCKSQMLVLQPDLQKCTYVNYITSIKNGIRIEVAFMYLSPPANVS